MNYDQQKKQKNVYLIQECFEILQESTRSRVKLDYKFLNLFKLDNQVEQGVGKNLFSYLKMKQRETRIPVSEDSVFENKILQIKSHLFFSQKSVDSDL